MSVYRAILYELRSSQVINTCPSVYRAGLKRFSAQMMDSNFQGKDGLVRTSIREKLQESLKPTYLDVINESNMHNVPKGSETHFKVVVVSDTFEGMPLIKRHRLVMDTLKAEMEGPVHALSIQAKTPQQWKLSEGKVAQSPPCLGGSKR